ncbi:MAG: guanylate kinase [Actinomycetota bacterium]|nr:guanylate kinase [Actinomycetota bacterium]
MERDPGLWLSRSWTTRPRRPGESQDAYTFVDDDTFATALAQDGFLEHATFAGHLYGTPWPKPPEGKDLLLEIDLQGARQVKERYPDAVLILLLPPSPSVQAERMRARGDVPERIAERIRVGLDEAEQGRAIADHVVINDELEGAVSQVASILERHRSNSPGAI